MKKIITFLMVIVLSNTVFSQGLTIGSGTTFSLGSAKLSLSGSWNNSGTYTAGSGSVIFSAASGNQTITNSGGETFYNLTINKNGDDVKLTDDITISGTLTTTSGDLDLNGNVLTLTGTLIETDGNTVIGSTGYITCSSDLNAPSNLNPHGIGIEITSTANLGSTTIIRGHEPQSSLSNTGMSRYFEIIPTNNSSLDATLIYNYDDSELNSIEETTFQMFNSDDNGTTWNSCTGTLDETSNTYTVSGINSFSRFTLASSTAPLPVELTSFTAAVVDNAIKLNWETATEVNNYGFEVQRRVCSNEYGDTSASLSASFETIAFVEGHGNSNSPKEYEYIDNLDFSIDHSLSLNKLEYRLKQIDTDGSFTYYNQTAKVNIQITDVNNYEYMPSVFELKQNYPNPFNPTTTINYSIPTVETGHAPSLQVQLIVYDMLGREVATIVNREQAAGNYSVNFNASELPSGMYIYIITAGNFVESRKMLLMK